jgi:flagellar protein FlgJ
VRDLVETVIAQVMKQDLRPTPAKHRAPAHTTGIHKFTVPMNHPASNEKPVRIHRDERLWRASRQFEAMMFQQMLSAMRKTIPSSGVIQTGFAEDVQGAMFDQAVAKSASQQGNLGIANSIYRQLSHPAPEQKNESRIRNIQADVNSSDIQIQQLEKARTHTGG